jgi:hypothetical protein
MDLQRTNSVSVNDMEYEMQTKQSVLTDKVAHFKEWLRTVLDNANMGKVEEFEQTFSTPEAVVQFYVLHGADAMDLKAAALYVACELGITDQAHIIKLYRYLCCFRDILNS